MHTDHSVNSPITMESKTPSQIIKEIEAVIDKRSRCLCAFYENCEICDSMGQYNILRNQIKECIYGPSPKPTLNDYERSVKFTLNDLLKGG